LIWVEVPFIPASPATCAIYLYYGNALASGVSNGDNTFIFFDDFEDGVVDSAKWLEYNMDPGASFSESAGKLKLTDTSTEADPWGVYQGLMAQAGGNDWNPPENSFKLTLDNVHWSTSNPNVNLAQGNWGVSLAGSKNPADIADGNLSIFMNDAWSGSTGRIRSSEDGGQTLVDSGYVSHDAVCDFIIYKDDDNTVHTYYNQTKALDNASQTKALSYLLVLYEGDTVLNYEELTIDTLVFQKWVDPEPSHSAWGPEQLATTSPPIPGFPFESIAAGLLLTALFTFLTKRRANKRGEARQ
jgi:hypothetical protein